jgi:hypothetical protein
MTDRKDNRLCCECVGEVFLRSEIQRRGVEADCSYCGRRQKTFTIGEMADALEIALREHFYKTPTEPSDMERAMMSEGGYDWERRGDPVTLVIEESAEIELKPAEDIQKVLEERHYDSELAQMGEEQEFDEDAQYAETGVDVAESQAGWFHFEKVLKTEARYFSQTAEETLASIFEGIADHKTREGNAVIVEAGPNKPLAAVYRARVFQSDERLEEALKRPDREIGPPPFLVAAAGRMNAHGISVFYGATDPLIALAELRPPVGSKVVIARFEFLRTVRLLDVEALRSVNADGSLFDLSYKRSSERAEFLKWLSGRITMPVMPDGEPFEYLATQAVADFLAASVTPSLDGIIYPSAQGSAGKLNVVLFHKSARVESLDIPKGTEIDAQLYEQNDDGVEVYPWVWEWVPPQPARPEAASIQLDPEAILGSEVLDSPDPEAFEYERREPVLKLDISNVEVHVVRAVEFQTESHSVRRHRSERSSAGF